MKKLSIIFSLLFLAFNGFSQEKFQVLHVRGTVMIDSSKKAIKVGDEIENNLNIKFSSENDLITLTSSKTGRFNVSPKIVERKTSGELVFFLRENFLPAKDYTGTRGEFDQFTYLYFAGSKLMTPIKIRIAKKPNSVDSYYYLVLNTNKGENIIRRLQLDSNGNININNSVIGLFENSNQSVTSCEVKFYDSTKNKSFDNNTTKFIPKQIEEIKNEIALYKDYLIRENKTNNEISNLISEYLSNIYGDEVFSIL